MARSGDSRVLLVDAGLAGASVTFEAFCSAVVAWCYAYNGSITRWGSTEAHNAAVGGVAGSPHRFFLAVDVVYGAGEMATAPQLADAQARAKGLGLLVIRETTHDHLQALDWPAG